MANKIVRVICDMGVKGTLDLKDSILSGRVVRSKPDRKGIQRESVTGFVIDVRTYFRNNSSCTASPLKQLDNVLKDNPKFKVHRSFWDYINKQQNLWQKNFNKKCPTS